MILTRVRQKCIWPLSSTDPDTTLSKPHQDIIEAYLQMKCSIEEIVLLESEMAITIHFYAEQRKSLLMLMDQMKHAGTNFRVQSFQRGAIALLHSLFRRTDKLHQECSMSALPSISHNMKQLLILSTTVIRLNRMMRLLVMLLLWTFNLQ